MLMRFVIMLAACSAAAVAADWYGVFGQRDEQRPDFVHVTFKSVDRSDGTPIAEVHVACTRSASRSACTERRGAYPGETKVTLGVLRKVERTLVFSRDAGISLGGSGPVTVTFIHPDYERHALVLTVDDIVAGQHAPRVVELDNTAK